MFLKFCKIHRKTPVPESFREIFKNTFFYRRSLEDCFWRMPETLLEIRKGSRFWDWWKILFTSFSKILLTAEIRITWRSFFAKHVSALHFQKQEPQIRHCNNLGNKIPSNTYLKRSASTYENSASQFFRSTTGKGSETDSFEQSRVV